MSKKTWEEEFEEMYKSIENKFYVSEPISYCETGIDKVKIKKFIKDLIKQKQKEAYVDGYKEAVQGLKSVRERKPIEEIDLDKASVEELKDIKQQLIEELDE